GSPGAPAGSPGAPASGERCPQLFELLQDGQFCTADPACCMSGRCERDGTLYGRCACSSYTSSSYCRDAGVSAPDASTDGPGTRCGTTRCAAGELCVETTITGSCQPLGDGGACPAGTRSAACGSGPGCVPFATGQRCVAPPPTCTGAAACGCATDLCGAE